ncbi:MAG: hypothetical protein ACTSPQ_10160 [Candidatus Helarchaeota archaeon]
MKVFLAASFRIEEDQKFLERIRRLLEKEGNAVWCAKDHIGDYYGTEDRERLKEIIEIEKDEILKSDLVVVLLNKLVPGPIMQLFYAAEFEIPTILYLKNENDGIRLSPWLRYHCKVVRTDRTFLIALSQVKKKVEKEFL